jgi:uncharacterized caspase-like protein
MTVPMKFLAAIFALVYVGALAPSATRAQTDAAAQNPRIALVIGNSAYPDHPLATAANDAGLVAQTLQAAGFEVVGARDLDQNSLRGALRDFLDKAAAIGPDMQAFVYLSGRGVQYEGDNYFVPVDARIARDADVPIQAVKISDFSHALAATPGRARILVLDAARANSFAASGAPLAGGLALVDPEAGSLIAFNTAPGAVAPDEPGPYGAYGKSLAGAMRQGGLPIEDVFAQTRLQVNQQTNGAVIPWSASKVEEPYSIFDRAPDAPPPPAIAAAADIANRPFGSLGPDVAYSLVVERDTLKAYQEYLAAYPDAPQARRVRAILAARREAIFWRRSVADNSPRAYWTYLRVYPNGPHVADAQRRLQILAAQFQPPPDFAPLDYSDLPPPPPDELVYDTGPTFVFDDPDYGPPPPPPYGFVLEEDESWRNLPPPPPPRGLGFLPVLPIAIPLLIGAKPFHKAGLPPIAAGAGAPPPLPHGFKPHRAAPAAAGAAPAAEPLRPLKPLPGVPGAGPELKPAVGGAKPLPVVPGAEPAVKPAVGGVKLRSEPLAKPVVEPALKPAVGGVKPRLEPLAKPVVEPTPHKPERKEFKAAPTEPVVPPAQHLPPPVEHVAPPVQHAAPPPPQQSHPAPSAPAKRPACGAPHEPPCPK